MKLFFAALLIIGQTNCYCQTRYLFHQNSDPIQANPAFVGLKKSGILNLNFNYTNKFSYTYSGNYSTLISKLNSGLGIYAQHSERYYSEESVFGLAYSYQIKIGKKYALSTGISLTGSSSEYIDYYSMAFKYKFFAGSTGIVFYSKRFFLSTTINELRPKSNYVNVSSFTGFRIPIKSAKDLAILPIIGFNKEGTWQRGIAQLNLFYNSIKCMVGVKTNGILLLGLGYDAKLFALQYYIEIYDTPVNSPLATNQRLSLQMKLPKSIERKTNSFDFQLF